MVPGWPYQALLTLSAKGQLVSAVANPAHTRGADVEALGAGARREGDRCCYGSGSQGTCGEFLQHRCAPARLTNRAALL